MSGSGISWAICMSAPRSRQITMPVPTTLVFYRPDALPAAQPTASKHWRHCQSICVPNLDYQYLLPMFTHSKNKWTYNLLPKLSNYILEEKFLPIILSSLSHCQLGPLHDPDEWNISKDQWMEDCYQSKYGPITCFLGDLEDVSKCDQGAVQERSIRCWWAWWVGVSTSSLTDWYQTL